MHMADALLSPAVGGVMWAASAATIAVSSKQVQGELDDSKIPLMGVLGAFIFAAQMINFTIPGTGSSGHLGGGMILAILLGPWAAFLTMASVLLVQSLFFADGGILALGCNIFNLGFFTCFLAYPLVYKKIVGIEPSGTRLVVAAVVAAVVGLQLGSFGVVAETVLSGVSELPFRGFILLMQPIHLVIGVVEGLVTAAMVSFVVKARPELAPVYLPARTTPLVSGKALAGLLALTLVAGGCLSWFASAKPDGLEWALTRVGIAPEPAVAEPGLHAALVAVQERTALLPGYAFKERGTAGDPSQALLRERAGTSAAGLLGGLLTLLLTGLVGLGLKYRRRIAGEGESGKR